jgi:pyridoxine 4-dehydrogenase
MEQLALGQLHWSAANYAPFQEQALWDGLVAVYEQVIELYLHASGFYF